MGRERLAQRERRKIYFKLKSGEAERRPLTEEQALSLVASIDHRNVNDFGVRKTCGLELDGLQLMPEAHTRLDVGNGAFERRLSLLGYAAWRRRHAIVKHLLIAGASPTVSERAPEGALHDAPEEELALRDAMTRRHGSGMPMSTAVHVVESVARLRCLAARDAAAGIEVPPCAKCGKTGLTLCFDPCGCAVCEPCCWREVDMTVERRRTLGKALCFLMGPELTLTAGETAEGEVDPEQLPEVSPADLQIVLDRAELDRAEEAEAAASIARGEHEGGGESNSRRHTESRLAMRSAIRGERVRAVGIVRSAGYVDGRLRWEVLASSACLLKPYIFPEVRPKGDVTQPAAADPAAAAQPGSPGEAAMEGGEGDGSSMGAMWRTVDGHPADGAIATSGGGKARKPKFKALPPREAALQQLMLLTAAQRRDAAATAAASGNGTILDALSTLEFDLTATLDEYGQTAIFVAAANGHAPAMRFLCYAEAGGGLPPHVDLSRTRRDGKTSTCTFILYLTGCRAGGETVLLNKLEKVENAADNVLAAVTPTRGRLLLFPHHCPHMAREVVAEGLPKLLLRGEML